MKVKICANKNVYDAQICKKYAIGMQWKTGVFHKKKIGKN